MAVTLPTATRNALADNIDDLVNAGAGAGKLKLYTAADALLVTITLQDPAFGAAAAGVITLAGVPLSGTASGTGTATYGTLTDSNDVERLRATVGAEITIDNAALVSGQTVNVTAVTVTMPAS